MGDCARGDCPGEPVARAPGAAVPALRTHRGRAPTTPRALTGRNVCPVAEATSASGAALLVGAGSARAATPGTVASTALIELTRTCPATPPRQAAYR